MGKLPTTRGVQIDVIELENNEPVTDAALIVMIVQDLTGDPTFDVELESDGHGGWLATVPADWYAEASEEDGLIMTHSGGYALEIPMP